MTTATPELREQVLAALNSPAILSLSAVAEQLAVPVREAILLKSLAGVSAVFRSTDGEPIFWTDDLPKIRAAREKYGVKLKSVRNEPLPGPTADQQRLNHAIGVTP